MNKDAMTEYRQLLKSKGISLDTMNIAQTALEREDALFAVDILKRASVPISGGDVYFKRDAVIETGNANWATDQRRDETYESYAERSWERARTYIRTFRELEGAAPLFQITPRYNF